MNEERLNYIKEKVNMRNMANVMCGFNTDKTDNEILELIHEIEKLKQENKQLKKKYENAVSDYEQEHYKVVKARKYCKTMLTYGIRNNREQAEELLEILGDKE